MRVDCAAERLVNMLTHTLRHVALAALDVIADGPLARTHPSGGIAGQLAGGVVQVRYGRGDVLRCSNADAASSVGWGNICGVEGAADFPLCLGAGWRLSSSSGDEIGRAHV